MRFLICLALCVLPIVAQAERVGVDVPSVQGEYTVTFVVGADGKVAAVRPLPIWGIGGMPPTNPPPTNPPPTNPPPGNTVQAKAHQLTLTALSAGGTRETAARLALAYSVVSDQVLVGNIAPADAPAAVKFLSDNVIPANEVAAWAPWRLGIGDTITGRMGSKEVAAATFKSVYDGTRLAVDGLALKAGEEAFDWNEILKLLLPILLMLLQKWLNPMGM